MALWQPVFWAEYFSTVVTDEGQINLLAAYLAFGHIAYVLLSSIELYCGSFTNLK